MMQTSLNMACTELSGTAGDKTLFYLACIFRDCGSAVHMPMHMTLVASQARHHLV